MAKAFKSRLVGTVFKGTANHTARITIHIFAESPEELMFLLRDRGLRYCESERLTKFGSGQYVVPGVILSIVGADVELLVFPCNGLRQAPLSPVGPAHA